LGPTDFAQTTGFGRRVKITEHMIKIEHQTRKQYYTIKEAADYLSISDKSVRRLVKRGLLRPSRALRKLLIPIAELEGFFARTASISGGTLS
jgi:excisionase family DNA binding protein